MSDITNAADGIHAADGGAPGGRPTLITGGAGFVGCNLAAALLAEGRPVRVLDDLSRPGVEKNLRWLRETHPRVEFLKADVRDAAAVRGAVRGCGRVYHFAAQVAVTTSLSDPAADFEVNARGTLNVLEALRAERARRADRPGADRSAPALLFTSTNKVYGDLGGVETATTGGDGGGNHGGGDESPRHTPVDAGLAARGVDESRPLDFHSPYGCSKGAADQYVLDYARTFRLPATVFRMSCIYGPHQFGTEDQGWVAHFARAALRGGGVTFYGDGRQVRDVLHVSDLVRALRAALDDPARTTGRAFNIGGGPPNAVSLRQVVGELGPLTGGAVPVRTAPWRAGDQKWYVSDTAAFRRATGWEPRVDWRDGLADLIDWLGEHVERPAPGRRPGAAAVPPAATDPRSTPAAPGVPIRPAFAAT